MDRKRVVITGMGTINPCAHNLEDYWNCLVNGISGVAELDFDTTDLTTTFGAQVRNFDPLKYMDPNTARRADRFSHFAIAAAKDALEQAKMAGDGMKGIDGDRVGVILGSGIGGIEEFVANTKLFLEKGPRRVSPFFITKLISNIAAGYVSLLNGFRGPNYAIASACATSNHCILEAWHAILRDDADIMVAGGTESSCVPITVAGFGMMRALSRRNDDPKGASRPFDVSRDGFVLGEGAGVVILEEYEHAKRRGAPMLAEILGGAMTADAHHITEPDPSGHGQTLCFNRALKAARIDASKVTYVNAHGTSTPAGDVTEIQSLKAAMGDHWKGVKVNSTKSIMGHLLGAAGAAELIAVILQMEKGILHPSINITELDPAIDAANIVVNKAMPYTFDIGMSNGFGFGGHNSTLVVGKVA